MSASADRLAHGIDVRRKVLGDAHVQRAEAAKTPFDEPFQRLVTEMAWGSVWSREQLDLPTRSLITISLLAALGHEHELELHLHASRRTGATPEAIAEALLHVAIYAGVPAANTAFLVAKQVFSDPPQPEES